MNASTEPANHICRFEFRAVLVCLLAGVGTLGLGAKPGGRISQGYVQVRKTSGNNPFATYGVINDGGRPASGSAAATGLMCRRGSREPAGGQYSLFYNGVPHGSASIEGAWIYGLQQNAENRSNLALVNRGEIDVTEGG